jgi:site-specific DNA-cytosine methylase
MNRQKPFIILSPFDGISCVQIALHAVGITNYIIYASEINKNAIRVTQAHFPNTIQVGDVTKLKPKNFKDVDLICAGSPCQSMSKMGKGQGITTKSGIVIGTLKEYMKLKSDWKKTNIPYDKYFNPSALYWEFLRILRGIQKYNPNVLFFLENVRSSAWEFIITNSIGVKPAMINSSKVTAQNRERNYWTNIKHPVITDLGITLGKIVPGAVNGAGTRGRGTKGNYSYPISVRTDGKANCLVCSIRPTGLYEDVHGIVDTKRNVFSPEDAEELQTLTRGYTALHGLSPTARFKMIGNAWTVRVVALFFENLPGAKKLNLKPSIYSYATKHTDLLKNRKSNLHTGKNSLRKPIK